MPVHGPNQLYPDHLPDHRMQPFPLMVKGKQEVLILSQWADLHQDVQPDAVRAGSLLLQTPIHSFLFNSKGILLLAKLQAASNPKVMPDLHL